MAPTRRSPEAVVFDMDGVLVDSARIHARAWKTTFDEFLAHRGSSDRFVLPDDYRRHVDGRPRYQGVATFLDSRGIDLPMGDQSDPPGMTTITAVGNLKNQVFHDLLEEEEIEPLEGVIGLLDGLVEDDIPIAVVSSSRNTEIILPEPINERVDLVLGGKDLDELRIPGKPEPDMFVAAVQVLGVTPRDAAVVEDSPAGVRAGRRGGFSLVVGIDDESGSARLADLADIVVVGVLELPRHVSSWSDLLKPPAPALENLDTIQRLVGSRLEDDPTALYVGDDEDQLLAVRQSDGFGVVVDPEPSSMTWADFSVPDQEGADRLRRKLAPTDSSSAE